jgi:hypothetical protein
MKTVRYEEDADEELMRSLAARCGARAWEYVPYPPTLLEP